MASPRYQKPQSNPAWFAYVIPADEAIEVAEAWEDSPDVALRDYAKAAREYHDKYVALWWPGEEDF